MSTGQVSGGRARYLVVPGVPLLLLALYFGLLAFHDEQPDFWVDSVLGNVVLAVPALVCFGRAALTPARRTVFVLLGLACTAFLAGNITYVAHVQYLTPVPYPSTADIGYLLPYPLLFAAVALLAGRELKGTPLSSWLDGLLTGLACAAIGSVLTLRPVLAADSGSLAARTVGAVYPVADLTLAALIVAVLTLKSSRPSLTWVCLGSGVVVFAVADTTYLYRLAADTYQVGTVLDGGWALALNLLGVAAVLPYRAGGRRAPGRSESLIVPNVFCLVGIGVLIYGSLRQGAMPWYVVALVVLTMVTALQRMAVGFRALRLLGETQRQARTDELTQLSNRRHFDEIVQQALTNRRPDEELALLMIDLDGFKAINDTLGHHAGDELLRQIGPRLRAQLRKGDLLARLGGDEFGILLRDADAGVALAVADQVVAGVSDPFLLDGVVQAASASVGIALCPDHGTDLTVLLQHGDQAMFDAKGHGSQVVVYDPERLGGGAERFNVRDALARQELFLEYQPQIDDDGHMYGVEALVRWRHPELGLVPPGRFLPFFEQAGLMPELTLHVLDLGARDWQRWRLDSRGAGSAPRLSVNLAPSALLDDDLLGQVVAVLSRHGMPPEMLTLEITESVPVAESERSVRTLHDLVNRGIELSLDDYGTGWCSLSYLIDLPLNEVKIDRSFVIDLTPGSPQAAVIRSTIELASALGLRAIAEGVETPEALRTLRDLGCRHFQGYLLGRPMPARSVPRHKPNTQVFRTQVVAPRASAEG